MNRLIKIIESQKNLTKFLNPLFKIKKYQNFLLIVIITLIYISNMDEIINL